ncbi:MAG: serine hydrolase [bacterium]|nr:serine hydrolase [bacterium]
MNEEVVEQALVELTDEGIFAVGGQAAVTVEGVVVADVGVGVTGSGMPLSAGDLHEVYCLIKPMPYLLLAHVMEGVGCGPDELLESAFGLPDWCRSELTLRSLASHEAGLAHPQAILWRMTPPDQRPDLLGASGDDRGPAYSELLGGLVAEHVIEQVTGMPANQYCTDFLLKPLGLVDDIIVDSEIGLEQRDRIRVPVSGLPVSPLPMLGGLLPSRINEVRLAFGALATMRGVAGYFAAVGRVLSGELLPGLPSPQLLGELLDDDRPLRHDPTFDRPAKWAGGLIVDLDKQGISQLAGSGSVGHVGGLANSAAVYDPTRKASVAIYLNGVGASFEDQALPRQRVMDRILDAIPVN